MGRSIYNATMPEVTTGIEFDVLGYEWRCKWANKSDAAACQVALSAVLPTIKAVKGVKSVQRVVCGGHHDFKVVIACDFATSETQFREAVEAEAGVFSYTTQIYTLVEV